MRSLWLGVVVASRAFVPRPRPRPWTLQGAVTFGAPLVDDGYLAAEESEGPALLVYLPGFDGNALAPFLQWPALGDAGFDVRCASVDPADRSTLDAYADAIVAYARRERRGRPLLLVGESFGGILAVAVAQRLGDAVAGVVLVNPATSYARSRLAAAAPRVAVLGGVVYPLGLASLLPLFVDRHSFPALLSIVTSRLLPCVVDTPRREAYMGRVATTLGRRLPLMPRATLRWRLEEWLAQGSARFADADGLTQPTLIVYGDADATLPSADEALRLEAALRRRGARVGTHRVPGAGHAATLGSRVDLRAAVAAFFGDDANFATVLDGAPTAMRADAAAPGEASAYFGLFPREHPAVDPSTYGSPALDARNHPPSRIINPPRP